MDSTNVTKRHPRRIVIELTDDLWESLQAEIQARSSSWHKATIAEVVRTALAERLGMVS